jgi:hypothetical protein
MEKEKEVDTSKEVETKKDKLFKKPEGKAMYQKQRDEVDDAETEAFAKGELEKFNQEKAETATVQEDTETLEAWRKEYPDVYDMVETIAMTKADTRAKEMEEKYQSLQAQQEQISKEKAEVELLKLHPDFTELRQQDDFHEWAGKQDPTIQGWLYENTSNATLAARAIDLYKMDRGISDLSKKESKDLKKEAAKAISKTKKAVDSEIPTKKIWSNAEIAKMNPRTFAKFEAEIDEAIREGRVQP